MMYVYLDESGDLGFGQGGSRYFTIAFTAMENPVPFRRCVKKVKIKHNIPRNVELKGILPEYSLRKNCSADLQDWKLKYML